MLAAIRGARRIKTPLIFAVLTTVVAFVPLAFIPAGFGEVWKALPIIVIAMLVISLVESLLVLPNHLSHNLHGPDWTPTTRAEQFVARIQNRVNAVLNRFVQGPLDRAIQFATDWPGVTVAGAVGLLIVSISLIPAGIVPATFATEVEGDFAIATLEMPEGTTAEQTYALAQDLEAAGHRAVARLSEDRPADASPLLSGVTVVVGRRSRIETGGLTPSPTLPPETNIATLEFKLLSAQERRITTGEVVQAWREEVGVVPQARSIAFFSQLYTLGNPVEVGLSHPDGDRLIAIANSTVAGLGGVGGITDIRSDHAPGVPEVQVGLLPEARTLGMTLDDLARQTRAAFFGAEAVRLQRGRDEVRVYVRLPEEERSSITDVEQYRLRTPAGAEVPVSRVASLSPGISPPSIRRQDGQRVVTVSADVDPAVISAAAANDVLENTILAGLMPENPELTFTFGGEQQQQLDSLGGLYRGFAIAMLMVFALLAIPLRSYTRPFIVMAIIPFGFIGVILGHWILGVAVSAESFVGIFGLAGVVVNDSLVMIDFTDQKLRDGVPARTAIIEGAKGRFRPIMLTSLTTFVGFTPLILEDAIQAQFFVPFSASIGCGILFTTALVMVLVPALSSMHMRLGSARRGPPVSEAVAEASA